MRTRELIQVAAVERDRGTQSRIEMRMDVVEDYATALRAGGDVPPVEVFEDSDGRMWLADGWHRLFAHEAAGLEKMWAVVHQGTRRDAIFFAAGANADHGLRRTNADKRRAVELLLADPEWAAWSDRAIAQACRVTHPFVAQVRQVVTVTTSTERQGRDGKLYPVSERAAPERNAGQDRAGDLDDRNSADAEVVTEAGVETAGLPSGLRPRRDAETEAYFRALDKSIEDGTWETGVAGVGRDDVDGAAPEEPVEVMGGPEEPVAPPSSLPRIEVQDDAREDRGVGRGPSGLEGPSAVLPSSPLSVGLLGRVLHAEADALEDNSGRPQAGDGAACLGQHDAPEGFESPHASAGALEDEEVVVRRPGSTSQASTTARRNAAPGASGERLIDLRCCSNLGIEWPESDLDVVDPPWSYVQRIGSSRADNHYTCLPIGEIVHQTERLRGARVALWATWPTVFAFLRASGLAWRTGGAWTKSGALEHGADIWSEFDAAPGDEDLLGEHDRGHYGPGYHWAGCSEPVLLATRRPAYTDRSVALRSAWIERPFAHSEKPVGWMAQWIRRWVPPGGLVCDPYAGLGTVARAVLLAGGGRRYLGTEVDPERHAQALQMLSEVQGG